MWHGYFAVEDLNLNAGQRQVLVEQLEKLGPAGHPSPAMRNHWRVRLDDKAVIFEALFKDSVLTVDSFRDRLAALFSVDPATIDSRLQNVTFKNRQTPIATFSRGGTDYLRFAAFGGVSATWMDSGDECRGYLAANRAEWESDD